MEKPLDRSTMRNENAPLPAAAPAPPLFCSIRLLSCGSNWRNLPSLPVTCAARPATIMLEFAPAAVWNAPEARSETAAVVWTCEYEVPTRSY